LEEVVSRRVGCLEEALEAASKGDGLEELPREQCIQKDASRRLLREEFLQEVASRRLVRGCEQQLWNNTALVSLTILQH
jgi:hypothetical protein